MRTANQPNLIQEKLKGVSFTFSSRSMQHMPALMFQIAYIFGLNLKAAQHIHTVWPRQTQPLPARTVWSYFLACLTFTSVKRCRGGNQARHDCFGAREERPPAGAAASPVGSGVGCSLLRRAARSVLAVLQQLSLRGVSARWCVGYRKQSGCPTGLQFAEHLQERFLGEKDGGQH